MKRIAMAIGCAVAARQLIKASRNIDLDGALGHIGLMRRHSASERVLPAIACIGLGAAVGAGVALMMAPSSGKELRSRLNDRLDRAKHQIQRKTGAEAEQYSRAGNGT